MEPHHETPLMPVRRLHNHVWCPRLFYLQWVENLFVENADTVAGSAVHQRVDQASHLRPDEEELPERSKLRSLSLASETLGITGIMDLLEHGENGLELLDYKRGSPSRDSNGEPVAKDNDAIQVAAYALLLDEHGRQVKGASIYYAAEKRRVPVALTPEIFARTRAEIDKARATAQGASCPPPLRNDPRCLYCSAYAICLPNESAHWATREDPPPADLPPPRPPGDEGELLVVQDPKARVGRSGGELTVTLSGQVVSRHPIEQLRSIYIYGPVQVSTQAQHSCLEQGIQIAWFSPAGRFLGLTQGLPSSGTDARRGQYRLHEDPALRARVAAASIRAKIHNQRVMLMRNGDAPKAVLVALASLRDRAQDANLTLETLRGIEGAAAAHYFRHFATMLKSDSTVDFDFEGRNRRPPRDPVNALLSLGYSILTKELTGICHAVGLDPFLGYLHQPRYGRPALALDLMEEFRPLIADSVAISLVNRGELSTGDFVRTTRGTYLTDHGRKAFWRSWFRRMDMEVSHPEFQYRMTYRRMLDVQARQFWRFCRGEASDYHPFTTR